MPQDDPDPPRKFYGFKPTEFDRANPPPAAPAADAPAAPDPGVAPVAGGRIDVHELARLAQTPHSPLGPNAVQNRPNEVHAMLQLNLERERAAGLFDVPATVDKQRRQRMIRYWIVLVLFNAPLAAVALYFGPGGAIPFVCAIAGIGMFTAWWTWENWFLRTER